MVRKITLTQAEQDDLNDQLQDAIERSDAFGVKHYLEEGAQVTIADAMARDMLLLAVESAPDDAHAAPIIEMLLAADQHAQVDIGSALVEAHNRGYANTETHLYNVQLAQRPDPAVIGLDLPQVTIQKEITLTQAEQDQLNERLFYALSHYNNAAVRQLLVDGAEATARDPVLARGTLEVALRYATSDSMLLPTVELLLAAGADDLSQTLILLRATRPGYTQTIKLLEDVEADPSLRPDPAALNPPLDLPSVSIVSPGLKASLAAAAVNTPVPGGATTAATPSLIGPVQQGATAGTPSPKHISPVAAAASSVSLAVPVKKAAVQQPLTTQQQATLNKAFLKAAELGLEETLLEIYTAGANNEGAALIEAVASGATENVRLLVALGADVTTVVNNMTAHSMAMAELGAARKQGNQAEIVELIKILGYVEDVERGRRPDLKATLEDLEIEKELADKVMTEFERRQKLVSAREKMDTLPGTGSPYDPGVKTPMPEPQEEVQHQPTHRHKDMSDFWRNLNARLSVSRYPGHRNDGQHRKR